MSELVETYRGCEIYHVEYQVVRGQPAYMTPCLSGKWFWTLQATKNAVDDELGPEPPPPEPIPPPPEPGPEPEREWVEKYRDVDVWLILPDEYYWAQVEVGYVAIAWTLTEVRRKIDEILELLYPGEEPPDGLLAQIMAQVMAWFDENIGPRLQPIYDVIDVKLAGVKAAWEKGIADFGTWASHLFADHGARLEELDTRWDTWDTETLPDLNAVIEAMAGDFDDALAKKAADLQASEAELRALGDDAVKADVRSWFPAEFLKDPLGYIGTAFTNLINAWVQGVTKSFWEGFEEGLEEEVV